MKPDESDKDPAVPVMAMDILNNVLNRADNPGDLGAYLTEEVRDLTGARCVLLLQCLCTETVTAHRVVSVNPLRRREWAESPAGNRLYELVHRVAVVQIWRGEEPSEVAGLLRREGFELSMVFPLNAGGFQVGAMLVLGLPDEEHITSVLSLLNHLSAIVALVLRNAFLYEKQEQVIREREDDLRRLTFFQRTILDNAAYGIISTTPEGIVTSFNPAAERLLGYSADEMVGKQTPACWHDQEEVARYALRLSGELGETITPGFEVFTARARRNLPEENEWNFICKDGRRIPINLSVTALRDEEGHITGFVGMGYDLTERKRAEDALRENQARLDLALRSAGMGVWHLDVIENRRYFDDRVCHLLGINPATFTGAAEEFFGAVHPDDRETIKAALARTLEQDLLYEPEYRAVWQDRSVHYIAARGRVVRDNEGRPLRINGIIWDITERKRSEEALRRERALLRCIIDSTSDLIFIKDREGVYLGCNKASENFIGLPEKEQIGKTDFDFFDPEMGRLIRANDRQVIEEGETLRTEEWVTYPDGSRVLLDTLKVPFDGPDGEIQGLVGYCRDITERKRAEEELAKLNEELEQRVYERTALLQQKTEELEQANERLKEVDRLKSTFIASMSHELRTPLNAIIGFSSVLLDEWVGPVNAEQKQNLASILGSGRHLLNMINDILDVTQIEAGKLKPVIEEFDLYDLLAEAQNKVTAALQEKGVELRSEPLRQRMRTDRRRLLQCVLNLLSNAAKFTEKGSVTVAARIGSFSGETPEEEMVEISVTDTGIGIGEEDLARIFHPFIRIATPQRTIVPGTGLGLFLTRKIATEVLKGDLLVSSEYGKGSRFSLRIPARLP